MTDTDRPQSAIVRPIPRGEKPPLYRGVCYGEGHPVAMSGMFSSEDRPQIWADSHNAVHHPVTPEPEPEFPPSDAMHDVLYRSIDEACGIVLGDHLDDVVDEVLAGLARRLGGFIIDPLVIGYNSGVTVPVEGVSRPAREVYLAVEGDNLVIQYATEPEADKSPWVTLES